MQYSSMADLKGAHRPDISYRHIRPSDLEVLEKIHNDLFPVSYESEFFHNIANGNGIVSWGAVDRSRPNNQSDELIGFVTTRILLAKDSEIEDLFRSDSSDSDQTLVYILTLGVVESYRNLGVATSLIRKVIKYASRIPTCQALYLHVLYYNNSAIHLYQKMSFQCVRRLSDFYFINGQHYDSFLFVYFMKGGRYACSPLELVTLMMTYLRSGLKLVAGKLWKNKCKRVSRWPNGKENSGLTTAMQTMRIPVTDGTEFQSV